MTTAPDHHMIDHALQVAALSPCRSKRGVAIYDPTTGALCGLGHNGPPAPLTCPGRTICAGTCGQRSVHAEVRALRAVAAGYRVRRLDLVHVELATDGGVVACAGPSCWQCSRETLDVGFVGGVWLFERGRCEYCAAGDVSPHLESRPRAGEWRRYTAEEFYASTLRNCGMTS